MKYVEAITAILHSWTDGVAAAIIAGFGRLVSPRLVRLIEDDGGGFAVETSAPPAGASPAAVQFGGGALSGSDLAPLVKGSRVEIVLQPKRFLFRQLELPAQAADFLDGIVRAQIDRLTPWSAGEAVFGCSPPAISAAGTMTTMIAATTRKLAMGYVEAVSGLHPAAVAICTAPTAPETARIQVFEQKASGHLDAARLSRVLLATLGVAAAAAIVATIASAYMADHLGAQQDDLARQIAQRRTALLVGSGADRTPVAALEARKFALPASVIVLEALSRVLPDHTYVTEFHLAGNKLQLVGITRDAPSLIPLIEQSPYFTRATFYAPTTRSATDPGERFHIEAQVEANNTLKP